MTGSNLIHEHIPDAVILDLDGTTTKRGMAARLVDTFGCEAAVLRIINASHITYEALKSAKKALIPFDLHTGPLKRGILNSIAGPQMSSMPISDFFAEAGIVSGLLSNNSRFAWGDRLMRHVHFGRGFDHMMFREDLGVHAKPSPYGALTMLNQMFPDQESKVVWVIGDMCSDMQMALNAGEFSEHTIVPVAMGTGSAHKYLTSLGMLEAEQALSFGEMDDLAADLFIRLGGGVDQVVTITNTIQDDEKIAPPPEWARP